MATIITTINKSTEKIVSKLTNKVLQSVNDEEAERIEGEITLNEASMALRNMKHSKSPGTDGFTQNFSKFFCAK